MNSSRNDKQRVQLRTILGAMSCAGVFFAAGCTTLPGGSSPEAISSYVPTPNAEKVATPEDGQPADLLLRDFFSASAHPLSDHEAARAFLTARANENWDAGKETLIMDRIDIKSEGAVKDDHITYRVRGNVVGKLGTGGTFEPEYTAYETTYDMAKSDGQWRIDNLRDMTLMDRSDFMRAYQAQSIYFVEQGGTALVPDRRWVYSRQQSLGASLISLLTAGPQGELTNAVKSVIPEGATAQTQRNQNGEFVVDFTGLTSLGPKQREILAAQVVWTLAANEVRGPYSLNADGTELSDKVQGAWNVGDVSQFDPRAEASTPLRALVDGTLVNVSDTNYKSVQGWVQGQHIESVDAAPQDDVVAIVSGRGDEKRKLMVGGLDDQPTTATEAKSLSSPSWGSSQNTLYTVADGRKVLRISRSTTTGETRREEVNADAIDKLGIEHATISVFRVSKDGTHVVMLINGRVFVSVLKQGTAGDYFLGRPKEIGYPLGDTAVAADWRADGSILVGTRASDAPVWSFAPDGSQATQLPSRNISAPVVAVESAASTMYATDARALMRLNAGDTDSQFWREVPPLQGKRGIPVLPH